MINFRDITTENPTEEIWKYLRYFLDINYTSNKISRLHNTEKDRTSKNDIKKQAQQIGYCIRQAEEYFQASSNVSLVTRPLLLYYGAVSLSEALILLKNDGNYSIDKQRNSNMYKKHGLDKKFESTILDPNTDAFFQSISCKVSLNERDKPVGHFANFYQSLEPEFFQVPVTQLYSNKTAHISYIMPMPSSEYIPLELIKKVKFNTSSLMKNLPDMYSALSEFGIKPNLCKGSVKVETKLVYKNMNGKENHDKTIEKHDFFIDGIIDQQKEILLGRLQKLNKSIKLENDFNFNIHLQMQKEYTQPDTNKIYYPDIVEDIFGKKFYIIDSSIYLAEATTFYMILFCLGMLCRYYPDKWVARINKDVMTTEIINFLLNIFYRKFPNLILDQMTNTKNYFHV